MRKRSFWLALAALAAVVTMTTGATAGSPNGALQPAAAGGTVIFGADQEPKILNSFLTDGNLYWLTIIFAQIFEGSYELDDKGDYVKELITDATVTNNPFTVTYKLKPGLKWSDGKPITSRDYVSTLSTIMNKNWDITSRAGYEDVARVQTPNATTARVVFKKPFAGWRDLFGALIPAHKVAGQDFNKTWVDSIDIASGPFLFDRWQKGSQLTLKRNPNYQGTKSKINQLVFRFIPDTNTQFQALRGGEVDMTAPQPQLQIADIKKQAGIRVQSGVEFAWEHLDIQLGPQGHPALKQLYVRQALVTGINRQQITRALYETIAPGLPGLQNAIFKPFEKAKYKPHAWQPFGFSQKKAIALLRAKGCTGGPAVASSRNSDIYSCPGVGKLSFRFISTAGNQLRELAFQIMQRQLKSIGIDLENRFRAGAFSVLPTGDWDLFMFTWIGSPDPGGSVEIHKCKGDQNYNAYCNAQVTKLLDQSQNTVDAAKRTALMNEADRLMAKDLPTLPLLAKPGFLIHKTSVKNVIKNPTSEGPTWNSELWTVAR